MLINYVAIIRPIHSPNPPDCIQLTRTAQSRPLCVSIRPGPSPHTSMHPHTSHRYPHHTYTSPMLHTFAHYVYTPDQTRHLPPTCTLPHHIPPARYSPSLHMPDWVVCRSSAGGPGHSLCISRLHGAVCRSVSEQTNGEMTRVGPPVRPVWEKCG